VDLQRGSHLASPPKLSVGLLTREQPPFVLHLHSGFCLNKFHALAALPPRGGGERVAIVWRTAAAAVPSAHSIAQV
jgi:hypothetical protein